MLSQLGPRMERYVSISRSGSYRKAGLTRRALPSIVRRLRSLKSSRKLVPSSRRTTSSSMAKLVL
jgi:hypothetical protein